MKKVLIIILLFLIQIVYRQESGCSVDCENRDGIWIDNNGNRYESNLENVTESLPTFIKMATSL
ncbi:hypothetical protein BST83_00285 [Polaribacter filamentus]|uniref:Uncharacterized protein n=1 Tax=Polaribacter filamentus TaxID=53483 RepID=A0A2S7L1Y8_9FLAO|nr:hypothetical protein BST83_00285 [Polaribacter filamentus]